MKKVVIVISTIIAFIIIYLLQSNFFNWFTIAGVKPNLFIILVLFIGLFGGKYLGISLGVFFGLMIDILIGKKIGVSAIMLGGIGILGGYFDKNFSKESKMTIMLMVIGSTILYEIGIYFINAIIFSYSIEISNLIIKALIETIYNAILTIILYPIMQRVGFFIEDTFKENRILTRYF